MALLFNDPFTGYTSIDDLLYRWARVDGSANLNFEASGGPFNKPYISFDTYNVFIGSTFINGQSLGGKNIRGAFWCRGIGGSTATGIRPMYWFTSTDAVHSGGLQISSSSARIGVTEWDDTSIAALAFGQYTPYSGQWHHFEFSVTYGDGTAGSYYTWLDGRPDLAVTGVDNNMGTLAVVDDVDRFNMEGRFSTTNGWEISDVVIWCDQGGGMTGYLGPHKGETIRPTSDQAVTFSRSGGTTNYENVDEAVPDNDTTYVYSGTTTDEDYYEFGSLSETVGTIKAVVVAACVRVDEVGSVDMRLKTRENAVEGNGATLTITQPAYFYTYEEFLLNPDTAAAWTITEVNAAQFGLEIM